MSQDDAWLVIRDAGWGADFAAGRVIELLHRGKDQAARWYYERLIALASPANALDRATPPVAHACAVLADLDTMLTRAEHTSLVSIPR